MLQCKKLCLHCSTFFFLPISDYFARRTLDDPMTHSPRDPENDLSTRDIAEMYGISIVAAGSWFRRGVIPEKHAYRIPAARSNGIIGLEWRADREYMLNEFKRPNPRGGRPPLEK